MRCIVLLVLGLFLFAKAKSQSNDSITIKFINQQQQPLVNASVEILQPDSSLYKIFLSDKNGIIKLENIAKQALILRASATGYQPYLQKLSLQSNQVVQLLTKNSTMDAVTISIRKPFIELHPDMTVVNMEASISNVGIT